MVCVLSALVERNLSVTGTLPASIANLTNLSYMCEAYIFSKVSFLSFLNEFVDVTFIIAICGAIRSRALSPRHCRILASWPTCASLLSLFSTRYSFFVFSHYRFIYSSAASNLISGTLMKELGALKSLSILYLSISCRFLSHYLLISPPLAQESLFEHVERNDSP